MVPAPGQAAIAIQVRKPRKENGLAFWITWKQAKQLKLNDRFLIDLDGGCQVALGVHVLEMILFFFP